MARRKDYRDHDNQREDASTFLLTNDQMRKIARESLAGFHRIKEERDTDKTLQGYKLLLGVIQKFSLIADTDLNLANELGRNDVINAATEVILDNYLTVDNLLNIAAGGNKGALVVLLRLIENLKDVDTPEAIAMLEAIGVNTFLNEVAYTQEDAGGGTELDILVATTNALLTLQNGVNADQVNQAIQNILTAEHELPGTIFNLIEGFTNNTGTPSVEGDGDRISDDIHTIIYGGEGHNSTDTTISLTVTHIGSLRVDSLGGLAGAGGPHDGSHI